MRSYPVADPGDPDIRSASRYLLWLAARNRVPVLLGMMWGTIWMVAHSLLPAAIGRAVDALATTRSESSLLLWCGVLVGLGAIAAATGILRHRNALSNYLDAAYRTVQLVNRQAARLGSSLSRKVSSGEVVGVGTADISSLGRALDVTARGTAAIVTIIVIACIMLSMSLPLGLLVLIGVPVLMGLTSLLLKPLHKRQQAYRDLQGDLAGRAVDIAAGLRVLRGIGGERIFATRYRGESQKLRAAGVRTVRVESFLEAAQFLVPGIFVAVGTWLAARFALDGSVTVGEMVAFYGYAAMLEWPLATLTEMADKFVRGHVAAGRVVKILALTPDVTDPAEPRPLRHGALEDRASGLRTTPGEFIAVACHDPADGPALADRLGRYTDADVTYGGVPLAELALDDVRRAVLVAHHEAVLFAGTLEAELDPHATGTLDKALYAASAHDIVDALPDGLKTRTSARGRDFSGGQVQRLRLVRALVDNPEVLILIEPTSAVDAHTEARIAERVGEFRAGRTTVVITTSPLLLAAADRVVHIEGGLVAASGTHRSLLSDSARYAALVTRTDDVDVSEKS